MHIVTIGTDFEVTELAPDADGVQLLPCGCRFVVESAPGETLRGRFEGPCHELSTAPTSRGIPVVRIGRNEPCLCGSGKKFKRCCIGSRLAS